MSVKLSEKEGKIFVWMTTRTQTWDLLYLKRGPYHTITVNLVSGHQITCFPQYFLIEGVNKISGHVVESLHPALHAPKKKCGQILF